MQRFLSLATLLTSISVAQTMSTYVGVDWVFPGNGKPALQAPLGPLTSVTIDNNDNPVFVANSDCLVGRLNKDGTLSVIAGNGFCGYTFLNAGNNGLATSAGIFSPKQVAFDRAGNFYISIDNAIRKVDTKNILTNFAGANNCTSTFSGDGGPARNACLSTPGGMAVDSKGNFYFSDRSNHRIRRIDPLGIITTVAGTGEQGNTGDNGPARNARISSPTGIVVDSNDNVFFVTDSFIRRFNPADQTITTVVSNASEPNIALHPLDGSLYLGHARVRRLPPGWNRAGQITNADLVAQPIAATGENGFSGDGLDARLARTNGSLSIAIDRSGNLFLADFENKRIRKVSNGIITTVVGNGNYRFLGDNRPASLTSTAAPAAVIATPNGEVYYSEEGAHRVVRVRPDAKGTPTISIFAGNGNKGRALGDGTARSANLAGPTGLAFDPVTQNLFIADLENNRILRVTASQTISEFVPSIRGPYGLLFHKGFLYASSSDSTIKRYDSTGREEIIAGTSTRAISLDTGPARSIPLDSPIGMDFDAQDNLYVADAGAGIIRRIVIGGLSSPVADIRANGATPTTGRFASPVSIVIDRPKSIAYIAERFGNRVHQLNLTTSRLTPFAGTGRSAGDTFGITGDGRPALDANLPGPYMMALDPDGNLLVPDTYFRIRRILATPPSLKVDPTPINMPSAFSGGPPVFSQITIDSTLPGFRFSTLVQYDMGVSGWLQFDTLDNAAPRQLDLTANPANLPPGSYTATLTLIPDAGGPPISVSIKLTVDQPKAPQLSIDRLHLPFTIPFDTRSASLDVKLSNIGGGLLNYSISGLPSWLKPSTEKGAIRPGQPATVRFTATTTGLNPGAYSSQIRIDTDSSTAPVILPVSLVINSNPQAIFLTQTGLSFTAVAGGSQIPSQSFGVLNLGTGFLDWQASVETSDGAKWLSITPNRPNPCPCPPLDVATQVSVSIDPTGLAAGQYYGTVSVSASQAANLVSYVTIFLDVKPAGTSLPPAIQPSELNFEFDGVNLPPSQSFKLFNVSNLSRSFTASLSGRVPALLLPGTAQLDPVTPTDIIVQPVNLAGQSDLTTRFLSSILTFRASDGQLQRAKINIFPSNNNRPLSNSKSSSRSSTCIPESLSISNISGAQSIAVPVSWPVGLSVRVTDNCNQPLLKNTGAVKLRVTNAETKVLLQEISLSPLNEGTWQGSWYPSSVLGKVKATISASATGLRDAELPLDADVDSQSLHPVISEASILNPFFLSKPGESFRAISPGSLLTIYRASDRIALAQPDATAPAGAALPTVLGTSPNQVQVKIAGFFAPLQYVGEGQINVFVPWRVPVNTTVDLLVIRGPALSAPVRLQTAAAQPTLLRLTPDQVFAQAFRPNVAQSFNITSTAPARRGDTLVLYAIGLGATSVSVPSGAISPQGASIASVRIQLGDQSIQPQFAGLTPGLVGIYEINFQIPNNAPQGPQVPLSVFVGSIQSPISIIPIEAINPTP